MSGLLGDDRGETLIELMITVMVISIGVVTLLGALGSAIVASDAHRGLSVGEVVALDYGEAIKIRATENKTVAGGSTYVVCPGTTELDPGSSFVPEAGWSAAITQIEWWVPSQTAGNPGTWSSSRNDCLTYFSTVCPEPDIVENLPSCDSGLQRVTYDVWNDREGVAAVTLTASVIVRRANDPTPTTVP